AADIPEILARATRPQAPSRATEPESTWTVPERTTERTTERDTETWDLARVIDRMRAEEASIAREQESSWGAAETSFPDLPAPHAEEADRQRLREAIAAGDE